MHYLAGKRNLKNAHTLPNNDWKSEWLFLHFIEEETEDVRGKVTES